MEDAALLSGGGGGACSSASVENDSSCVSTRWDARREGMAAVAEGAGKEKSGAGRSSG
jgi:hypothetical protein